MKARRWNVAILYIVFALFILLTVGTGFPLATRYVVSSLKEKEMKEHLRVLAVQLVKTTELRDTNRAGFHLQNGELMCGGEHIRWAVSAIDEFYDTTNVHFAFFNAGKRVNTTIKTKSGARSVDEFEMEIWDQYVSKGEEYFTTKDLINDKNYWGYYVPIRSNQGFILGMAYAGVEASKMEASVEETMKGVRIFSRILCGISLIALAVSAYFVLRSQRAVLKYMRMFVSGDFSEQIPEWLTENTGEFGEMGRHLITMRDTLDGRVQKDTLTGLFNRRAAMYTLKKYFVEANTPGGETFCFAIGDIDFFKKVNDTYGHNCGDAVLQKVAQILSNNMKDFGFVARWGGEEFILVFKGKLPQALRQLEYILATIRAAVVEYDDYTVKVTMTFGIVQYHAPNNLDYVITAADKLLYKGKESGRNQIVS